MATGSVANSGRAADGRATIGPPALCTEALRMRRQPVAFALVDAAFLADSKWRALRRRLPEPRDYNSAVGAWLIILTAARRNGLPDVDAAEEAEDETFLPDLVAVGLLSETGVPNKPFKAWAPARPKYPSDLAPSAPNVTDAPFPPPDSVSTPFPSLQLNSIEGGAGGNEPHIEAWLMAKHRLPTKRQQDFLDRYLQVFDVTGPQRMAMLILRHPDDPIAALKEDLDTHREERLSEIAGWTPAPKPKRKREPWQDMFKAVLEAKEAAIIAAAPLAGDDS